MFYVKEMNNRESLPERKLSQVFAAAEKSAAFYKKTLNA